MKGSQILGILVVAPAIAVVLSGCGQGSFPGPDVVARIGDQELAYADFERYLRANSAASEVALSSEVLSGLFDQYLDEALLVRLARDREVLEDSAPAQSAVRALLERSLVSVPSEAEIAQYYAEHRSEFERKESVVLSQILLETHEAAAEARAAIAGGMSFEEASRRFSQGPGAEIGGFQGELGEDDLPPAFAEVIFGLEEGEASEIVSADYGFHLFRVIEKRPPSTLPLSDVRAEVAKRLRARARVRALERLVEEARKSYNVAVYARNLPFNYDGLYQ